MLTSREKPTEVAITEGMELSVRSLPLKGELLTTQKLIQAKGLSGSQKQQQQLCDRYGGNPLALKIVATSIQDLFDGEIEIFLAQDTAIFNSIQKLLDQQFERLSYLGFAEKVTEKIQNNQLVQKISFSVKNNYLTSAFIIVKSKIKPN